MRFIALFVLLLSAGVVGATEAYRWVDKDGVVHYGDKPKHDAQALDVKPGSGNGPTPETLAKAAECERQKGELAMFRKASSLNEVDAQGHKRAYSAEERQQFLDAAEKKMNDACGLKSPAQP